jgi:simple sugar transport system ATP-binding protein
VRPCSTHLFIGREETWNLLGGLVRVLRWRRMEAEAAATLARLDIHIPSLRPSVDEPSGGQRQALAIARALRWNAELVILDEPTAALSVGEQAKVLEITRTLAEQGVAVICITHDILAALCG